MARCIQPSKCADPLFFLHIPADLLLDQSNNDEEGTAQFSIDASGMKEMVDIAALNSRIKFDKTDVPFDQRIILGDATETGLTRFAGRSLNSNYDAHLKNCPKVFEGTVSLPHNIASSIHHR